MDVQFSGAKPEREEQALIDDNIKKTEKICEADLLHINIKNHKKAGGRMSHTVQLRLERANDVIATSEYTDWDFPKAVNAAFSKLRKEVKSKRGSLMRRLLGRRWRRGRAN